MTNKPGPEWLKWPDRRMWHRTVAGGFKLVISLVPDPPQPGHKDVFFIEVWRARKLIIRDGPFAKFSVAAEHVAETVTKLRSGEGFSHYDA